MKEARVRYRADRLLFLMLVVLAVLAVAACASQEDSTGVRDPEDVAGGDPERGEELMVAWGCGSCHVVPGIPGADGTVGPPLSQYAHRDYVAGNLLNDPENLIRWIMNPQAIEPGTGMPNMGIPEDQARDMAAYLYTLK